jgi:hypothetical protein
MGAMENRQRLGPTVFAGLSISRTGFAFLHTGSIAKPFPPIYTHFDGALATKYQLGSAGGKRGLAWEP